MDELNDRMTNDREFRSTAYVICTSYMTPSLLRNTPASSQINISPFHQILFGMIVRSLDVNSIIKYNIEWQREKFATHKTQNLHM